MNESHSVSDCEVYILVQILFLTQIEKLENDVQEINARYASVNDAVSTRARQLQRTITQSQGIQGAITDIKSRLDSAQVALTSQQPISLELPVVAEQEKQFRLVAADVNRFSIHCFPFLT